MESLTEFKLRIWQFVATLLRNPVDRMNFPLSIAKGKFEMEYADDFDSCGKCGKKNVEMKSFDEWADSLGFWEEELTASEEDRLYELGGDETPICKKCAVKKFNKSVLRDDYYKASSGRIAGTLFKVAEVLEDAFDDSVEFTAGIFDDPNPPSKKCPACGANMTYDSHSMHYKCHRCKHYENGMSRLYTNRGRNRFSSSKRVAYEDDEVLSKAGEKDFAKGQKLVDKFNALRRDAVSITGGDSDIYYDNSSTFDYGPQYIGEAVLTVDDGFVVLRHEIENIRGWREDNRMTDDALRIKIEDGKFNFEILRDHLSWMCACVRRAMRWFKKYNLDMSEEEAKAILDD